MDPCVPWHPCVRERIGAYACVRACVRARVRACVCVRLALELVYELEEVLDEHVHPLNVVVR